MRLSPGVTEGPRSEYDPVGVSRILNLGAGWRWKVSFKLRLFYTGGSISVL